ncbi:MAG: type II toxin-antitoxin system VapC family toxin [Candidatus Sericytochromatia bacterium]|nr:type II toxin-antitoxin system VapC family toxin [Candidatus Tanganyikabacteria bacterium]
MVIDTSAIAAHLFGEEEAPALERAIAADPVRLLSAATLLEAGIVIEARLGEAGARELDWILHKADVHVVPFDADQAEVARHAFRMYGRGRHPAGLNLGDCFAYALSVTSGEALLFKGQDFSQTDVRCVAYLA